MVVEYSNTSVFEYRDRKYIPETKSTSSNTLCEAEFISYENTSLPEVSIITQIFAFGDNEFRSIAIWLLDGFG